jgi:hypothetical protein
LLSHSLSFCECIKFGFERKRHPVFFGETSPPRVSPGSVTVQMHVFERLGLEDRYFDDLTYKVRHAGGADRRRVDFTDIFTNLVPFPRGRALVFAAPCAVP